MKSKKILIFGGSGSLGKALIDRHLTQNIIINYSRDEWKHWQLDHKYKNKNLINILGDIRDLHKVREAVMREKPHIIIIASALKHIERVEYSIRESIETNLIGVQNVLDSIESNIHSLKNLEKVVFVSSDKACSPVNVYGMCKALSEKLMIEKAYYIPDFDFVICRYGNVLNSKGSIIPLLHKIGRSKEYDHYNLTHPDMTRFVMTLDESCSLVEYAMHYGESGDIIIPKLKSMYIRDLISIFSDLYSKPVKTGKIRFGEKINESLINETQSLYVQEVEKYYYIKAPHNAYAYNGQLKSFHYSSGESPINKSDLYTYLESKGMLTQTLG
ncbi:MAG TPA: polysaccharide biosynthesis protein [Saprospiraceae bacterium]|nr:polysaccharide biosynthesis protein [Saprospiraceae bacterium]